MKIKITATCIIDDKDFPVKGEDCIKELNENEGEAAFDQLQCALESGTEATCIAIKVE